ncbi:MAG: hypothetical protein NXY57DRAFT_1013839 [Lentinula lateritia]|uniref:MARVEL domain-containing protein n=1 Tax=Lentinula lateritia TaxID=40482 RepID=A0ABQ8VQS7_9AGAR|nr:MAG: hypothetical protein NXY57DRAFT_1013839 [Lentinula lateritia]KAJ4498741.1 hypothetical protein C8R41DRAFT_124448 [Lentinula lateritia]
MRSSDIRRNDSKSSTHPLNSPRRKSRMPSLFNSLRGGIYVAAILFTVICLAMAGHFEAVLASSDLTRFVPFALFVGSASLLIILLLLGFSFLFRERNPISTRLELASLALAGIFWLALGIYLASSDSQSADVECFASATSTQVLDDSSASFHTEQYQAMYRVLNAFSLINATLLLIFAFGLFLLALRRHRKGDEHMWYGPVTSCAWFNEYSKRRDRVKRSQSGILPVETVVPVFTEKPSRRSTRHRSQSRGHSRGHSQSHRHRREPTTYPARVYQSQMNSKYVPKEEPQSSGSSLLASTTESFDNGTMKNPNRR